MIVWVLIYHEFVFVKAIANATIKQSAVFCNIYKLKKKYRVPYSNKFSFLYFCNSFFLLFLSEVHASAPIYLHNLRYVTANGAFTVSLTRAGVRVKRLLYSIHFFKLHNTLQGCSKLNSVGNSPWNYTTIYHFICIIVVGLYVINSRQKSSPYPKKSVYFEGCFGRSPSPCWGQMSGRYSPTVFEPSTAAEGIQEGINANFIEVKRKLFIVCHCSSYDTPD